MMDWLKDIGAIVTLVGFWGVVVAWSQVIGVFGMIG
jgi:hypothetical protein